MSGSSSAYLVSEVGGQAELERLKKQAALAMAQELPALLTALPQGGCFHDLGCGSGELAFAVAMARPDATVIATDMDGQAVAAAKARCASLVNVHCAAVSATAPDKSLGKADVAVLRLVLMHVPQPQNALQSLRAWLKPGGELHVIEGDDRCIKTVPSLDRLPALLDVMEKVQVARGGSRRLGSAVGEMLAEAGYEDVVSSEQAPDPSMAVKALPIVFFPVAQFYLEKAVAAGLLEAGQAQEFQRQMMEGVQSLQSAYLPLFHVVARSPS